MCLTARELECSCRFGRIIANQIFKSYEIVRESHPALAVGFDKNAGNVVVTAGLLGRFHKACATGLQR
jgi:hypothetical protein